MTRRAVSPVLGLALLVGMVAVASVSLLLVSTALTDDTRSSIDQQQAEQSLAEFSETAERLAKGDQDQGQYEIEGASRGTIRGLPSDGDEISVRVADGNDTTVFWINRSLGSVTYDAPDGSQVAFQGGGVWRRHQNGETVVVDPPRFHYREQPEPTLTFPLVLVRDQFSATGQLAGTMETQNRLRHYPDDPNHYNPLRNGSVTVTVDSLYCDGWEHVFREQTDGSVTESCDARGVTEESEVRVQLSVPFEIDGIDAGAMFNGYVDESHIDGNYTEGGHAMASPTRMVTSKVEACADGEGTDVPSSGNIDGPGLYCIDGDAAADSQAYTVNASAGDVDIAVDGSLPHAGGLDVTGENNVSVFVDDNPFEGRGQGNSVFGNSSDPSQLRIYVSSGNVIDPNAIDVYGLVYAPTSDVRVRGQFDVVGGLVADEADLGGNSEVEIDPSVLDVRASFQPADSDLYFLHISETEVVFEGD